MEKKLNESTKLIFRIACSALLIEFVLHFTYSFGIMYYHKFIFAEFSPRSLVIAQYLRGLCFGFKYMVFYGLPTLINNFIGIKTNALPRCISVMHTNSELWR